MENSETSSERPANFQEKLDFFKTVIDEQPGTIIPWDSVRLQLEDMSLGETYSETLEIRREYYLDWTNEDFSDLLAELDEFKNKLPQKSIAQETLEEVERMERGEC